MTPAPGHSTATCGGVITSGSDSSGVRYSIRWARSPGLEAQGRWLGDRTMRCRYLGLTFHQAECGQQAHLGLIADRQAFGDNDRAAQPAAKWTADGDLERAEDRAGNACPDVGRVVGSHRPADERHAAADAPDLGVPADIRPGDLGEPEPRRCGINRRAERCRDARHGVAEHQVRPRLDFHRVRAAALQADGLHVVQGDTAELPAVPAERDGRPGDPLGLPGELKLPVGRMHDPDLGSAAATRSRIAAGRRHRRKGRGRQAR